MTLVLGLETNHSQSVANYIEDDVFWQLCRRQIRFTGEGQIGYQPITVGNFAAFIKGPVGPLSNP